MQIDPGDGESQPGESTSLSDLGALFDVEEGEEVLDESEQDEGSDEDEVEETEEGEAEAKEPEADPTVVLKHDGKEVSLKQSEVVALAQQGFDYTNKTMAVAEERKAVEAEKAKAAEYRSRHEQAAEETLARLETVKAFLSEQVGSPPPIEWASTDAGYYLAQKEIHEQRKGQLQQAEAAIEHLTNERQRQRQASIEQQANDTISALRSTLPGFSETTLPELEKYVHEHGLNPQNAEAGYVQKGLWELAHKAKAYDALMAEKAKLKPIKEMPKVTRPAASNPASNTVKATAASAHSRRPSLATLGALFGD